MTLRIWWLVFALYGCSKDGEPKEDEKTAASYLNASDQILPPGVVGQLYEATLAVSGGSAPYSFYLPPESTLPLGLTLDVEGKISGIPAAAGDYVFQVVINDILGEISIIQVTLPVALQPQTLRCGDRIEGSFLGSAVSVDGPELTDLDNIAWIGVEMPGDQTTRVELLFEAEGLSTLYVERPSELLGSPNIDDHYIPFYLNPDYSDMSVSIDAGTIPSLTGYLAQPLLPMLLVAQSAGDWSLDVACSDGPIFTTLAQYPTEIGKELLYDYDVFGDNSGVRIWTEDPLPDWMIWDETTGTITGIAEEPGAWEFTVIAETEDGRRREESTIVSVYDVLDITCDVSVPLTVQEGYFDGDFYAFYDPRGFAVYKLPTQDLEGVSAITTTVSDSDGHYLGLASPDPEWLNFYGGAERLYLTEEASLTLDPTTYPAIGHYLESEEQALYISAGTIGADYDLTVTVTCDRTPRPDLAALPVFQPLTTESFPLHALGGSPPYTWSASDLPSGISLDPDGTLRGQSGAIGSHEVEITVADKLGASSSVDYTLFVGNDAACDGYEPILCGDTVEGTFTDVYFGDNSGPASTRVFCIVEDDQPLGFEIESFDGELRVDIADPGRGAIDMFNATQGTYVTWVDRDSSEGVGIDPFTWPNLDDYEDMPILLALRAYEAGDWAIHLACP